VFSALVEKMHKYLNKQRRSTNGEKKRNRRRKRGI